jgi:hypothetical protein
MELELFKKTHTKPEPSVSLSGGAPPWAVVECIVECLAQKPIGWCQPNPFVDPLLELAEYTVRLLLTKVTEPRG